MKFVTIASDETTPGYLRLKNSAEFFGIPLENIGAGKPYLGNGTKIMYMMDYLRHQPPDEVVLYTDAYDSMFLSSPDKVEAAFNALNHPVVFSAEQNFSMKSHPLFYYWINFYYWLKYPNKDKKPYRYINAGSFVGKAGPLLKELARLPLDANTPSDQTIIHKFYINNPTAIALDHRQTIFACNGGRAGLESTDYNISENRVYHARTDSYPCVLHVPGNNRTGLEMMYGKLLPQFARPLSEDEKTSYRRRRKKARRYNAISSDNFLIKTGLATLVVLVVGAIAVGLVMKGRLASFFDQ